ncbi:heat-inducible transcriptional repressor HrcA [Roseofilum reptotaenium CS-1145]|uniref:Heat-inducible transcription repressor HrcA n=1 Tax=Roseofilum reptotaenium AO1-A TaxID=1925591 RepID=A0A1L9QL88_9CYAN|nr:heat-inducible transcriptional repressor HrcA [Roseofilum reptotaenium]MDB9519386.1 heat-inducible transcriptional repressor HrcA [Roseofilum reptotaenium CS-1145]OJJ18392.1 heat-inducible transcriptional repressor HrcA [Roseofilum reptotaenium AO1-A]
MHLEFKLSDRHKRVLQATVNHYVATAEPVGSKVLVEEYNFSVSTATIRSCLSYLDKSGLLYQPHTSAGRVPSDSGYRWYVDHLMTPNVKTGKQVESLLQEKLNWQWSLEALFKSAAQILSSLSGYITLITMPQAQNARLHHLQLVAVDSDRASDGSHYRAMLILVTDTYQTHSTFIDLPKTEEEGSQTLEQVARELQVLSNFLNHNLKGRLLTELEHLDWTELDSEFERYGEQLTQVLNQFQQHHATSVYTDIWMSGVAELLRQPEFSQLHQVQALIHLLEEEPTQLLPLIVQVPDREKKGSRVQVWIGSENPLEPMQSCALVTSSYFRGSLPVGSVGVLGPTRMMYENAIAVVEATAGYLSDALS